MAKQLPHHLGVLIVTQVNRGRGMPPVVGTERRQIAAPEPVAQ